jgi:hypothetical protein
MAEQGDSGEAGPSFDRRVRLTRALLLGVLVAAVATAPLFAIAEGFDAAHLGRVAASNGGAALLCLLLLLVLRRGHVAAVGRALVFGLLLLVGTLASTSGEDVHVNVVNFVLVALLAGLLTSRRELLLVALLSTTAMVAIAWRHARAAPVEEAFELRCESIAQFLPTYVVIVFVLWLVARPPRETPPR